MGRVPGAVIAAVVLVAGMLTGPGLSPATATTARAGVTPTVHRVLTFGTTVKGRPLNAYRIGNPASLLKVVLMSTMHGDETGTAKILLDLMHGAPVSGADIWVIPYLNSDGVARGTRKNARGVDLNRNFPVDWKRRTGRYNSGRSAASEPETKALMRFLAGIHPQFVISLHQPLNGVDTSYGKARKLALRLADELGLPKKVFDCNSGCHGTMTQWYNKKFPGAALTVEYGARLTKRQVEKTGPEGLLAAVFSSR